MNKIFIMLLFLQNILYAYDECRLAHESMVLIAKVEQHPARKLGYPYLISFNKNKDAKIANKYFPQLFIYRARTLKNGTLKVGRTIDCKNETQCIEVLKSLENLNIRNLDLGAYQVNYIYHKLVKSHYFRVSESYYYACSYAQKFVDKYGSTFKSLAMYHSSTPKYRNKYAKRMYDVYTEKK